MNATTKYDSIAHYYRVVASKAASLVMGQDMDEDDAVSVAFGLVECHDLLNAEQGPTADETAVVSALVSAIVPTRAEILNSERGRALGVSLNAATAAADALAYCASAEACDAATDALRRCEFSSWSAETQERAAIETNALRLAYHGERDGRATTRDGADASEA